MSETTSLSSFCITTVDDSNSPNASKFLRRDFNLLNECYGLNNFDDLIKKIQILENNTLQSMILELYIMISNSFNTINSSLNSCPSLNSFIINKSIENISEKFNKSFEINKEKDIDKEKEKEKETPLSLSSSSSSDDEDDNNILSNYLIKSVIYSGVNSVVFHAINIIDDKEYAIKRILCNFKKKKLAIIENEIKILKIVDHVCIVKFYEVLYDKENNFVYLIFEYINGEPILKSLSDYKYEKIEGRRIKKFIRQILSALFYLHHNKIAHMDLKPDNILIDKYDNVYLIDFGISQIIDNKKKISFTKRHIIIFFT
jgi:tRNA A-37 threonylcarbamoyl transferase component Bud32